MDERALQGMHLEGLQTDGLSLAASIVLFLVLGGVLTVLYRRSLATRPPAQRWILSSLRLASLGVLLFICALPYLQRRRLEPVPPRVALLVDTSPSMRLPAGAPVRATRLALAREHVQSLATGELRLELFSFARELVRGLGAAGGVSGLHAALAELQDTQASSELGAVLLFSDGRATDVAAAGLRVPIFAVPLGPERSGEVGVEAEALPPKHALGRPLLLRGRLFRSDPSIASSSVELWSGTTRLGTQDAAFGAQDRADFQFEQPADVEGLAAYRFVVPGPRQPRPDEALRNDVAFLATRLVPASTRILLIASAPGLESAFLGRQLVQESGLELTHAVALPDGRFVLADGASGGPELLLPLSRHAAVVAVGTRALGQLREPLAAYVQAGGGLLVLAGPEDALEIPRSGIASILPVRDTALSAIVGRMPVRPPASVRQHPLLGFLDELSGGPSALAALPPLEHALGGLVPRPGAQVLLELEGDGDGLALLTVHRYGQGRVGLIGAGPLWRWRFEPVALPTGKEETYIRLVPRLARWAAAGGDLDRFSLSVRSLGAAEPTRIRVSALREDLTPAMGQAVRVEVLSVSPDGGQRRVLLNELRIGESGSAEWSPVLDEPGVHVVRAAFEEEGVTREAPLGLNFPHGELAYASADVEALEKLARESGGRLVAAEQLPALAAELAAERGYRMLFHKSPLWSHAVVFALAAGLLLAEWALRRLWSLP
jgi:hypothetical protein